MSTRTVAADRMLTELAGLMLPCVPSLSAAVSTIAFYKEAIVSEFAVCYAKVFNKEYEDEMRFNHAAFLDVCKEVVKDLKDQKMKQQTEAMAKLMAEKMMLQAAHEQERTAQMFMSGGQAVLPDVAMAA
jgi:hypothetical protein